MQPRTRPDSFARLRGAARHGLSIAVCSLWLSGCGGGSGGSGSDEPSDPDVAGPEVPEPDASGPNGQDAGTSGPAVSRPDTSAPEASAPATPRPDVSGGGSSGPLTDDPTSDVARVADATGRIALLTLAIIDADIAGGVPLEAAARDCLGDLDSALGEPALVLRCPAPYRIDGTTISLVAVELVDGPDCRGALSSSATAPQGDGAIASSCEIRAARLVADDEFVTPPSGRPTVRAGAIVEVVPARALERPVLVLTSLERPVTGDFRCEGNIVSGAISGEGTAVQGDCDTIMAELADRLEAVVDR